MAAKKSTKKAVDDLRPEYDFRTLGVGVRGKYYERALGGTNVGLLDPDVAKVFPTAEAVDSALRVLAGVAAETSRTSKKARRSV